MQLSYHDKVNYGDKQLTSSRADIFLLSSKPVMSMAMVTAVI